MTMNWNDQSKIKEESTTFDVSIHADELLTNSSQEVASGFY